MKNVMRLVKILVLATLTAFALLWISGFFSALAKAQRSMGRAAYREGRYREALSHFAWCRRLGMDSKRETGLCLYRMGDLPGAERQLRQAGDLPDQVVVLGVIVMEQGRNTEAERILRSVLTRPRDRTRSSRTLAAYNLGLLYRRQENAKSANKMYDLALKWSNGKVARWSGPMPEWPVPAHP